MTTPPLVNGAGCAAADRCVMDPACQFHTACFQVERQPHATRRMHVTGYLGDEPRDRVFRFMDAATRIPYFDDVLPVRRGDGTVIAVAFYSRSEDKNAVWDACRKLERILGRDTEFLMPWGVTKVIAGNGGGEVLGEVVTDRGELAG